jgi:DNA-binding NarL/FixJ family response regulator
MIKRRLLLIASQSLFGTGIVSLLGKQKDQLVIEKVPDLKTALKTSEEFHPDVVVYFRETDIPGEESLLQELVSRYQTRIIHCTLQANHLTILDKKRIENATVEDLMSAVMK